MTQIDLRVADSALSGFGDPRGLLRYLVAKPGGVNHESFMCAFRNLFEAIMRFDVKLNIPASDLIHANVDGYRHSRWSRRFMGKIDLRSERLFRRPIEVRTQ